MDQIFPYMNSLDNINIRKQYYIIVPIFNKQTRFSHLKMQNMLFLQMLLYIDTTLSVSLQEELFACFYITLRLFTSHNKGKNLHNTPSFCLPVDAPEFVFIYSNTLSLPPKEQLYLLFGQLHEQLPCFLFQRSTKGICRNKETSGVQWTFPQY